MSIAAAILIVCGLFFFTGGSIGILPFPDFYSRLHATGKGDTLAVLYSLIGLAIHNGFNLISAKIVFIAVFMFLAQPTATHAISRAAFGCNVQPWTKEGGDEK